MAQLGISLCTVVLFADCTCTQYGQEDRAVINWCVSGEIKLIH